jgi:hypothetical protein
LVGVSAYFFIGYKDALLLVFADVKRVACSQTMSYKKCIK